MPNAELAQAHLAVARTAPPNPFVFVIGRAYGASAWVVFGDVVLFTGTDEHGTEPLSDVLAAGLVDMVTGGRTV